MEDPKIIEMISNLKGRRSYEEKKAKKLGYPSLYEYFKDKPMRELLQKEQQLLKVRKRLEQKARQDSEESCSCC